MKTTTGMKNTNDNDDDDDLFSKTSKKTNEVYIWFHLTARRMGKVLSLHFMNDILLWQLNRKYNYFLRQNENLLFSFSSPCTLYIHTIGTMQTYVLNRRSVEISPNEEGFGFWSELYLFGLHVNTFNHNLYINKY